jgi:prepilin signal peptidase PulO-like enzyme (type II secretory pathway)
MAVALLLASLLRSPDIFGLAAGAGFAALALCAAFDVAELRVPNFLTYSATIVVVTVAGLAGGDQGLEALAGGLAGGGFLLAVSMMSRGKVGLGDAKLATLGGALTGVNYVLVALFLGTLLGAVVYVTLLLLGRVTRTQALPYAPFLALGFILVALVTGTTLDL